MFGESLELRGGSPDKAQPHPGKRALNAPPHTDFLPEGEGETKSKNPPCVVSTPVLVPRTF